MQISPCVGPAYARAVSPPSFTQFPSYHLQRWELTHSRGCTIFVQNEMEES